MCVSFLKTCRYVYSFFLFNGKSKEIPQKWVNALQKKRKKNNNEKYKKINNTRGFKQTRITPRKERFLCQINNKKKKERIPLCLGLFARVDDLFTAGTNLNLVGVGILNGSSYCCFALKCVRFFSFLDFKWKYFRTNSSGDENKYLTTRYSIYCCF